MKNIISFGFKKKMLVKIMTISKKLIKSYKMNKKTQKWKSRSNQNQYNKLNRANLNKINNSKDRY